jgi:hypothetical protein
MMQVRGSDGVAVGIVSNAKLDEVERAQLAIDGQIEESQLAAPYA